MKHKTSVIITVLLVCVAFSLSAAVIPKNAVNVRLTFTAAFYSGKDGEKHYDSNYWVSTLTDIKAYREIWFTQLFDKPAYADVYVFFPCFFSASTTLPFSSICSPF